MTEPTYRERLREVILAKAGGVLEAEGLDAVQARRIAREADCSVGTLYNLFGDIDGLMIAVNTETLAGLGEAVRRRGSEVAALPLAARLTGLALAYLDFALANQQRWDAVFKHRLPPGREAPRAYVEDQERLLAVIDEALSESIDDAARRSATARALFGAVHGIIALALDNRLGGRLKGEVQEQVGRIVDLTARGIAAVEAEQDRAARRTGAAPASA